MHVLSISLELELARGTISVMADCPSAPLQEEYQDAVDWIGCSSGWLKRYVHQRDLKIEVLQKQLFAEKQKHLEAKDECCKLKEMLRVKDEEIDASKAQREGKVKTKEKVVAEKYNAQCAHLEKLLKMREKRLHEVRGDLWALEREHKRVLEAYEVARKKLRKVEKKEEDEKKREKEIVLKQEREDKIKEEARLRVRAEEDERKKIRQEELKKQFTFRL